MSNIDNLTFGEIKQIVAMFQQQQDRVRTVSPLIGEHVLVRTYSAGVHVGKLVSKDGENVLLMEARRIWKWAGAFTLSEVATVGIQKSGSRVAAVVPYIELTNANEIIPTSAAARATYDAVHES